MESEWKWMDGEWVNGLDAERGVEHIGVSTYGTYSSAFDSCTPLHQGGGVFPAMQPRFIRGPQRWTCEYCLTSLSDELYKCPNCGGPRYETNA